MQSGLATEKAARTVNFTADLILSGVSLMGIMPPGNLMVEVGEGGRRKEREREEREREGGGEM